MRVKRLLCVILAMAVVFCTFPVIQVSASGYTIAQVKEKFPDGKYWNHLCKPGHYIGGWVHTGSACGDVENTVTDHPCTSNYVDVGVGGYSCNTYKNIATQCCGFAKKVANLAYGVYDCASSWSCVRDKNKVASVAKPGDVLHYTGYDSSGEGHWVVVISVSGNVVTVAECNYPGGTCQIKWGRQINIYDLGDTIWLYQAPYKWTDCKHSYTTDTPYVCSKCNEWKTDSLKSTKSLSNVQYVITKDGAIDHTGPYGECKTVNKYSKNTIVTVTQEVVNAHGSTWYKLSNGNYIWGDYVKKYSVSYTNIAEGTYYLKNVANGQYMVVSQSVDESYRGVLTWEMNGEPGMKMKIFKGPTGYKMMPSMSSTRLINPNADKVASGNNINIVNDVNDSSQWWQFEKVGSYYVIHNVQNPACVLDAPNGSHSAVYANNYTGASSQKWVLEPVSDTHTHKWDNGTVTKEPTCTADGEILYSCSGCDRTKTEKIPARGSHEYELSDVIHPDCTQSGCEIWICKYCKDEMREELEPYGHDYCFVDELLPTCSTEGIRLYSCSRCNSERYEDIAMTEHNYNVTTTDATCLEGAYELKECVDCGDTVKTVLSEPSEHEFDVQIDSMPTCHTEGYRMSVCIYCEMQKHETIPMIEHRWDNGTVVKNPTASETGIITYKCTKCTAEKEEVIPVTEFLSGDVNLDGKITAADARLCLRAAARLDELTGTPRYAADYDNDNQVKAADARLILRKAAKLE